MRGMVAIRMLNSVVGPIILISLLSVVVLITKKSEKVTIMEGVMDAESGRWRAPDVEGGKKLGRDYISSKIDDGTYFYAPRWHREQAVLSQRPRTVCIRGPGARPCLL